MAMMCSALLAARSPPRLRRCRTVFPEDAGTGLTPHSDAKLASDRNLSGLSPAVRRSCAAPIWPIELRATRFTEGSHPGEHLAITLPGGGEASRFDDPVLFVDDRCDMQILVGIDAADDATFSFLDNCHSQPPALTMHGWLHWDRMRGQDSHETMRSGPSRVTGIGEAKPHCKAFPGGRQVRGKTRPVDRSAGQAAPGALQRQLNRRVHRCESQAAQKLAVIL